MVTPKVAEPALNDHAPATCVNVILYCHRKQLYLIVQEYIVYFNTSRPHQGLGQQIPDCLANGSPWPVSQPETEYKIISTPVLGGLHHRYS